MDKEFKQPKTKITDPNSSIVVHLHSSKDEAELKFLAIEDECEKDYLVPLKDKEKYEKLGWKLVEVYYEGKALDKVAITDTQGKDTVWTAPPEHKRERIVVDQNHLISQEEAQYNMPKPSKTKSLSDEHSATTSGAKLEANNLKATKAFPEGKHREKSK